MPANFRRYVDLTINDVSPTSIYLAAQEYARMVLPEFELRQGTVEDAMMQSLSYIQMLSVAAINRLPDRLMEGTLRLIGVQRSEGTRATMDVTIVLNEITNVVIPAGTAFTYERRIEADSDLIAYVFRNTEDITILSTDIPSGETYPQKTVTLTSDMVGSHLDPTTNQEIILQKIFTDVETVTFAGSFNDGTPPETDAEYLTRGTSYIRSLSSALSTTQQMKEYVLNTFQDVRRCSVYDTTTSGDLTPSGPPQAGNIVVFVDGFAGDLSGPAKTAITQQLSDVSTAGLLFATLDFLKSEIGVAVTIKVDIDYDSAFVEDEVERRLLAYLNPFNYSEDLDGVYASDVAYEVAQVDGVAVVSSITLTDETGSSEYSASGNNLLFTRKGQLPTIVSADIAITVD